MSTPKEPAYKKRIGYQGGILATFAALACTLLVLGNHATKDAISERNAEDLLASLSEVVPDSIYSNNLLADQITLSREAGTEQLVYRASNDGKITGVAFEVTGKGYAGNIRIMMGVRANGEILGVRVLSHTETPGLGDKIEVQRNDWITKFDNLSLDKLSLTSWAVKKDGGIFDQFSGATITPRAVVNAVRDGLLFFKLKRTELLKPIAVPASDSKSASISSRGESDE